VLPMQSEDTISSVLYMKGLGKPPLFIAPLMPSTVTLPLTTAIRIVCGKPVLVGTRCAAPISFAVQFRNNKSRLPSQRLSLSERCCKRRHVTCACLPLALRSRPESSGLRYMHGSSVMIPGLDRWQKSFRAFSHRSKTVSSCRKQPK
jgi:hypothetical protein